MKPLLTVSLIVELPPAIGFLLFPAATMLALAGVALDAAALPIVRVLGAALLAFCVLLWLARKSSVEEFARGVVACMLTYYAVSAVALLVAQVSGLMAASGWLMVLAHGALAAWCGYALARR